MLGYGRYGRYGRCEGVDGAEGIMGVKGIWGFGKLRDRTTWPEADRPLAENND